MKGERGGWVDEGRTDEATGIISNPALYLQLGIMLQSVGDPGHVDGVFERDLDPAVVAIHKGRIGKVVGGVDGGGRGCGEGGCGRVELRGGLRACEGKMLEEQEEGGEDQGDACGREKMVKHGHGGSRTLKYSFMIEIGCWPYPRYLYFLLIPYRWRISRAVVSATVSGYSGSLPHDPSEVFYIRLSFDQEGSASKDKNQFDALSSD